MPIAIKKAQKLVGISQDGLVGNMTLKALNNFKGTSYVRYEY